MRVRAHSVEPEFVSIKDLGGGAASIHIDLAYIAVSAGTLDKTGEISIDLLPSDIQTVVRGLLQIKRRERLRTA